MRFILAVTLMFLAFEMSDAKTRRRMLPAALAKDPRFFYDVDEKIVGGSTASDGQFPYIVSFQDGTSHFCGGSIYNSRWIITAAHCVAGENNANPQGLRIVAGNLRHDGTLGQARTVNLIVPHSGYSSSTLRNDIALLRLSTALTLSGSVSAVTLPASGQTTTSGSCTVSGWGTTSSSGSPSAVLLYVSVPVVTDASCGNSYPGQIHESMLCAGTAGRDSCQGDSGGPLYCNNYLGGVVSWGHGCALTGYPGVYTEVAYFRQWILDNVAANS